MIRRRSPRGSAPGLQPKSSPRLTSATFSPAALPCGPHGRAGVAQADRGGHRARGRDRARADGGRGRARRRRRAGLVAGEQRARGQLRPSRTRPPAPAPRRHPRRCRPAGRRFCALRSAAIAAGRARHTRRRRSCTPWSSGRAARSIPRACIDPGAGSGRFLLAAAAALSRAPLVGIEIDPLAAAMARANLAVHGLAGRAEIQVGDYRRIRLDASAARLCSSAIRRTCATTASRPRGSGGCRARRARADSPPASWPACTSTSSWPPWATPATATPAPSSPRPSGSTSTMASWCATCSPARSVLQRIDLIEPQRLAFADALTTAAIVAFRVGHRSRSIGFRRVVSIDALRDRDRHAIRCRGTACRSPRWSQLSRPARSSPRDLVELGELCAVHRGQVTGANRVWIAARRHAGAAAAPASPRRHARARAVRRRRGAGRRDGLRSVVDLPSSLESLVAGRAPPGRRLPALGPAPARARELHRLAPRALVVGPAARAGADPGHVHGAAPARLRAQRRPARATSTSPTASTPARR